MSPRDDLYASDISGIAAAGAAAGGTSLVLITLDRCGDQFQVDPRRSAHFVLRDERQESLRELHDELCHFATYAGIETVVLRMTARAARYQPGSYVRRMEAALELVPSVSVERVSDLSLRAWSNGRADELPASNPDLSATAQRLHDAATAAARLADLLVGEKVDLVDNRIRPRSIRVPPPIGSGLDQAKYFEHQ
jgi:hypothetical protein